MEAHEPVGGYEAAEGWRWQLAHAQSWVAEEGPAVYPESSGSPWGVVAGGQYDGRCF